MSGTAERFLTIITGAAIAGLLILNATGTVSVINSLGSNAVSYIGAVQGRSGGSVNQGSTVL